MSTLSGIFAILKFLPEVLSFVKLLGGLIEKGADKIEVMHAMERIGDAFKEPNPVNRARRINDIFRK